MNRLHYQRLVRWGIVLTCLGSATALVLWALSSHINLFYTPKDLVPTQTETLENRTASKRGANKLHTPSPEQVFRLGGMVMKGSVHHGKDLEVKFVVTDFEASMPVVYRGILPDLFREGQGVVATGILVNGVFEAREVLAKHDENYMPPELKKALE